MSNSTRTKLADAQAVAQRFLALLPTACFKQFSFAGSLRRLKSEVGDIDVVVIPRWGDVDAGGLFGEASRANLFWSRVDELVALGTFARHVKDTKAGEREHWGENSRSIEFEGKCFDVSMATADNWGVVLAVKTGPEPLPRELVERIKKYGYASRKHEGVGFHIFDMSGQAPRLIHDVTEKQFFDMAGVEYVPPEQRERLCERMAAT